MTNEDREKIISEDYADLLINYNNDESVFNIFSDATIHKINFFNAIVNIPVQQISNNTIVQYGYGAMPSLYGLINQGNMEASGIIRLRNIPNFNLRGQGVLIGVMDSGIQYTNPIFIREDGTSKIAFIWDQTVSGNQVENHMLYGSEYSQEQINQALKSENPLSVVPTTDEVGHGTMIAGIAAGNEVPMNDFYGVAPDAELVVVKLKQAKKYLREFFFIPENIPCYQENDILIALDYLISISNKLNRPIAICVALGNSQGAHDGSGILSNYLSLLSNNNGVGIIVAAGNEGNARRHYSGKVNSNTGYDIVELSVGEGEQGFSMEFWGDSPGVFSIDIQTPTGEYVPRIVPRLDENRDISFIFEQTTIQLDYQIIESQSGDQLILMRFKNPAPGIWKFNVYGRSDLNIGFNIWLPMDGFISENTFFVRSDPYITVLSLGNAPNPITVTAYNHADNSLYIKASRGYTRIGVIKPEIAAPGVNVTSPTLDQGFTAVTGTSAAAAFTTGVAAILLEWAVVKKNQITFNTLDMKIFMIRGARRDLQINYPNRDWGYGILDVFNVFDALQSNV